jgi:hypothetical protein
MSPVYEEDGDVIVMFMDPVPLPGTASGTWIAERENPVVLVVAPTIVQRVVL